MNSEAELKLQSKIAMTPTTGKSEDVNVIWAEFKQSGMTKLYTYCRLNNMRYGIVKRRFVRAGLYKIKHSKIHTEEAKEAKKQKSRTYNREYMQRNVHKLKQYRYRSIMNIARRIQEEGQVVGKYLTPYIIPPKMM